MAVSFREALESLFTLPKRKGRLNIFKGKTEFRAQILTRPLPIAGAAKATDDPETRSKLEEQGIPSKYQFVCRLLDDQMAHNKFLEDPCYTSTTPSPEETALLVSLHSRGTVSTDDLNAGQNLQPGDMIYVTVDPGDSEMPYDLQNVTFSRVDTFFRRHSAKLHETCTTLAQQFADGGWSTVGDYADPEIGNYIGTKGQQEVGNGALPAGLIGKTSTGDQLLFDVVAEFNKLAEAFKKGTGVSLSGGGYRSYENQVKVYDNPEKWRLRPDLKEKCTNPGVGDCVHMGATPGTSNHGWGMAFDWNTKDKDGKIEFESKTYDWMLKNAPKYGWEVPSFAQKGGSKEEAWHIEYVNKDKFITNIRDAPTDTDEADAAS